jgi:uncharacterized protein
MRISLALANVFLATAGLSAPGYATVKDGVDAWSRGDYTSALKQWRPAAIAGDADAQFNMGQAYKLGRGVPADLKLAEDWYRKAAVQGHLQAEDNYGLIMFQNGDRQRAMPYILKSAERGEPRAQYVYGTALFNGDMVKKDWPRAYALMTRASAAGIAPASASLAQMDKYIPLDQRQKGLAIARDLESNAQRPMLASAAPANPPKALTRPPIRPAEVPPSQPGVDFDPQPAPAPTTRAVVKPVAPPKAVAVAKPAPKPAAPAVAAAPGGKWRVQLGAFGDANKAKALWNTLEGRVGALGAFQPYLVKAGAVTRLQAGPLGSQAAAEKLCASVRAAGNACLTVGT